MTTSITQPAIVPATSYDQQQLDLIRNTVSKNLSPEEFALLVEVAKRTGLDLFTHQLYGIKRGDQMTIQTGIDGYRLMAARTGDLAGIDDALFEETGDLPGKASVTVWRFVHGHRVPFTASARWSEYKPEKSSMWNKMPFLMLGKCAEALALRKAFPAELSGIYTREEMDQADVDLLQPVSKQIVTEVIEEAQARLLAMSPAEVKGRIQEFQEITDSTNPMVQHIPAEPTKADWKSLKVRIFKSKLAVNPTQFDALMEQTGGDYAETLAKVKAVERKDLQALNTTKSRARAH